VTDSELEQVHGMKVLIASLRGEIQQLRERLRQKEAPSPKQSQAAQGR
jgi:hypothetical protein